MATTRTVKEGQAARLVEARDAEGVYYYLVNPANGLVVIDTGWSDRGAAEEAWNALQSGGVQPPPDIEIDGLGERVR